MMTEQDAAVIARGLSEAQRRVLYLEAPHRQGGHSSRGEQIAAALDAPFPLRMPSLIEAARRDGFDPYELWPWAMSFRAELEKANG